MRLSGKVALVTGAQQGIGRAIAIALAHDGADVGVNFLDDPAGAESVAGEVRGLGRRALVVKADVVRAAEVDAMVAAVAGALGPPDVLVNNAGVFPRSDFLEMAEREWDHVLSVNLKGGFLCAQAIARALVAAGRPGAIVNIASSAVRGDPRGVHYSASKAGVVGLTRAMALALAPHRIRVNAIAPSAVDTPLGFSQDNLELFTARPGATKEDALPIFQSLNLLPVGLLEPQDITNAALFLASDESRYITGIELSVDAGTAIQPPGVPPATSTELAHLRQLVEQAE